MNGQFLTFRGWHSTADYRGSHCWIGDKWAAGETGMSHYGDALFECDDINELFLFQNAHFPIPLCYDVMLDTRNGRACTNQRRRAAQP